MAKDIILAEKLIYFIKISNKHALLSISIAKINNIKEQYEWKRNGIALNIICSFSSNSGKFDLTQTWLQARNISNKAMTTELYFQRHLFLEWHKFNCDKRSDSQLQICIALELWLGNIVQRRLFDSVNYSPPDRKLSKNCHWNISNPNMYMWIYNVPKKKICVDDFIEGKRRSVNVF